MRTLIIFGIAVACTLALSAATAANNQPVRSFDGAGNNLAHPTWGMTDTQYLRVAKANYLDGASAMPGGPNARSVSNAIFNDLGQNLFSENNLTQFVWAWGQFVDHDIDLEDESPGTPVAIPFLNDPLERFTNQTGSIQFNRTPAAPGTGINNPRQQLNQISAYIDGSQIYGSDPARDRWLRGDDGTLLLPGGYLPKVTARGDASTAPAMDDMGQLAGNPNDAVAAGDKRANENIALTALTTLFVREHNRIVSLLPASLSSNQKFELARQVVGAEIEYITYADFLPTLGVTLPAYKGYDPNVNAGVANEFATVGFRAHSMVHGDFDINVSGSTYTPGQLTAFAGQGIQVTKQDDGNVDLGVPLALAFGNPDLLRQLGLSNLLPALLARQYKNDEQIDDELRSVLFEIPANPSTDPSACGEPAANPLCFSDVSDLGVDDVMRGRDHGMPSYNQLRVAYGLPPVSSFNQITGEAPAPPADLNDPNILNFTALFNIKHQPLPLSDQENASYGVRATTLASRLQALYGSVNNLDAFVGMVSEKHLPGKDFGPLQLAIWQKQFTATRDGDRFFYLNNPALAQIQQQYGIDFHKTLAQVIALNSNDSLPNNVFQTVSSS